MNYCLFTGDPSLHGRWIVIHFIFTVAMQQILGNKNNFVEQAIKQHEWWEMSKLRIIRPSSKENSRMDELMDGSLMWHINDNNSICIPQTVWTGLHFNVILSLRPACAIFYLKNRARWYVRMSLRHRQSMIWHIGVVLCVGVPRDNVHTHSLTHTDPLINLAPFPDASGPKWLSYYTEC